MGASDQTPPGSCKAVCEGGGPHQISRDDCINMGLTTSHLNVMSGPQRLATIFGKIANLTSRGVMIKGTMTIVPVVSFIASRVLKWGVEGTQAMASAKKAIASLGSAAAVTLAAKALAGATSIVPCCNWITDPRNPHRNTCV